MAGLKVRNSFYYFSGFDSEKSRAMEAWGMLAQ